jgi:hypothetical protein
MSISKCLLTENRQVNLFENEAAAVVEAAAGLSNSISNLNAFKTELNTSNEETSSLSAATATTTNKNTTVSNSFADDLHLSERASFSTVNTTSRQASSQPPPPPCDASEARHGSFSTGLNKYLKKKTSVFKSKKAGDEEDTSRYAHAYTNSYLESFSIDPDDPRRDSLFFLPNVPVRVQIIGHEEEPSLVLLHTNFYIINISHGVYNWTVKRRYKNFLKLYEAFALFKTKLNIKNVAHQAHLASGIPAIGAVNDLTSSSPPPPPPAIEYAFLFPKLK